MSRRILIMGGSGFLGSHIADAFSEAGHQVTIFDKVPSPYLRDDQAFIMGNILNCESVEEACKECDAVYHLAGMADIGETSNKPKESFILNVLGTINVIEAVIKHKVGRFLFASTVYVYSDQGSFYKVSKQTVESLLREYAKCYDLDYTILRYGSIYGPRAQKWNGMRKLIKEARETGRIIYRGTGEERREYIHVKDAARLSVQALSSEYSGRSLIITGAQSVSSRELMSMIKEIMQEKVTVDYEPQGRDPLHYSLTPYRFTPLPGEKIVPHVFLDLGQGLLELIEDVYHDVNGIQL